MKTPNFLRGLRLESDPEKSSRYVGEHAGYDTRPIPRLTWKGFWMGILVSMGGFIFGYDTGQISGFLGMKDFVHRFGMRHHNTDVYYFSNVRSGLIVALLSIGTLFGALIAAPIADWIGRKRSIVVWCCIFCVGIIVQITATHKWYQIMLGRLVAGFGVGALSLLVPMYQAETAPRHIRGSLIATYQLMITFGIFLAAVFNYAAEKHQAGKKASWQITLGLSFVPAVILGIGIFGFSETPRYNYRNGKIEKATQTMVRVYGVPENHYAIQLELEEIREKLAAEENKGNPLQEWLRMWRAPKMAYRIAIGMALQMFQQLTGANYFFYYGTLIFAGTGINNSFVTQMILNGINFGVTFYGLYIIERYGRRKSLLIGSTWMFICFLIFASVGHFALDREHPQNTEKAATAMICFASFFIFGFATTWGPMIWTICGELYPSRYRAKAMALSTASNWFWNFLLAFFSPFITGAIDFRYGYVFAGTNILGGLIVYFFVIEGQGRTLEEIDTMYLLGVKPWESAKYVVPSLEEMGGKMRERLMEGNPEMAVQRETRGVEGGINGGDAMNGNGGLRAEEGDHVRDGSEEALREKRETEL